MLVRTDEGYVPVPDRATEYTWDQPLHPERENPAKSNPHAAGRPAPAPAAPSPHQNGSHNGASPSVGARPERSDAEQEPVAALTAVLHDPVPPEPATHVVAEPVGPDVREISTALLVRPRPDVEPVRVSKKAVAVAVALVLGLPFGGKIVGLVKGTSPARSVASTAGGPVQALPRPLGNRAGFSQVSADAARYAVVITNSNRDFDARGVTATITFRDRAGRLVGTQVERVAKVPAGATIAVAGETGVSGTVASIEPRVAVGAFDAGAVGRGLSVRGVHLSQTGGVVVVRATILGRPAHDVRVVVVHFDRAGHVIGGDFTYVDVPGSKAVAVVVTTAHAPRVARVKVFAFPVR